MFQHGLHRMDHAHMGLHFAIRRSLMQHHSSAKPPRAAMSTNEEESVDVESPTSWVSAAWLLFLLYVQPEFSYSILHGFHFH